MSHLQDETRQYFLGIVGEQSGPFSEKEIFEKISSGQIPQESLVWFEGLSDWQPLLSIEFLRQAYADAQNHSVADTSPLYSKNQTPHNDVIGNSHTPANKQEKKDRKLPEHSTQIMSSKTKIAPVFSQHEGSFGRGLKPGYLGSRMLIIVFGLILIGGGSATVFYLLEGDTGFFGESSPEKPFRHVQNVTEPTSQPQHLAGKREVELRKATADLLLNPGPSLEILKKLHKDDPNDKVGKEAAEAAMDYLKQNRQFSEVGRLLRALNRPLEASQMFLSEPPSYKEAEQSLFEAYKISDQINKRDLLIQNIRLLLSQLNDVPLAKERIRLLEKEFPGLKHPFGYYLKSNDQRIADLFNRISFHFVQKLLYFIESEFPHLNLISRPLISVYKIQKEHYRIVGTYKGEVILNKDRLSDISMEFFLLNDAWFLVGTNLTAERGKWAKKERERIKGKEFSSEQMLSYLENVFKSLFPKHGLHEQVTTQDMISKNVKD